MSIDFGAGADCLDNLLRDIGEARIDPAEIANGETMRMHIQDVAHIATLMRGKWQEEQASWYRLNERLAGEVADLKAYIKGLKEMAGEAADGKREVTNG